MVQRKISRPIKVSARKAVDLRWPGRMMVLSEWSMLAYMSGTSGGSDGAPSRRAVQRADWLALGLMALGVQVDRMEQDGAGGIRFESYERRTVWSVSPDGSLSSVTPEGDGTRRTEIAGVIP